MKHAASKLEVHRHSYISGPNGYCSREVVHSHEGGGEPHQHEHTGPAGYTIDKDEWLAATGLRGGGRKRFTVRPSGTQLPIVALHDWQRTFDVYVVGPPSPNGDAGPGLAVVERLRLASGLSVGAIHSLPPKRAA